MAFGPKLFGSGECPQQDAERLTKTYAIRVEFGDPSSFYTPPYGPSDATAPGFDTSPADPKQAAIALEGVEEALKLYPPGFVDKLIDAIFICGDLRMSGAPAGGAAGPAWIVLSAPHDLNRESVLLTASLGVHHELSSVVLRYEPTTMARWKEFEPADARFAQDASEAISRGDDADPDLSTGFLSAYGSSTPENDFNTYAEMMFAEVERLKKAAERHALVRRKLKFVLEAYERVDSRMHAYFERTGLLAVALK